MSTNSEADRFAAAMCGWRPDFRAAGDQLRAHRTALLDLVGRRLEDGWTGWEPGRSQWTPSMPLVLVFAGGPQLEIAWLPSQTLSLTWNTVDLTRSPTGVFGPRPFWRSSEPAAVAAVAGRVVTGIAVNDTPSFDSRTDVDWNAAEAPADQVAWWSSRGLWIECGDAGLFSINGYDGFVLTGDRSSWARGSWSRVTSLENWPPPGAPVR